jgi:hypothetical protein
MAGTSGAVNRASNPISGVARDFMLAGAPRPEVARHAANTARLAAKIAGRSSFPQCTRIFFRIA